MEKPEYCAAIAGSASVNFADDGVLATRLVATISILSPHNMKSHKLLTYQLTEHNHLKTSNTISHNTKNRHSHVLFFSTTPNPNTNNPQNQTLSPSIPAELTPRAILDSVHSSQWHFIKHLANKITPSLISSTLTSLHKTPDLAFQFVTHIGFRDLDIKSKCLAMAVISHAPNSKPTLQLLKETISSGVYSIREVFNELGVARGVLGFKTYVLYDLLIRACCELKRGDDAFECFDMMKEKGVIPHVHACNDMLSLFLKSNRTEKAWVLYAEMFKLRIKSSVVTFNIMINVLCKEGKLKKAKEFIGFMEALGIKLNMDEADGIIKEMNEKGLVPDSITYNILINGYCRCGNVKKAFTLHDEMISKGVQPTRVTYTSLIYVLSKRGRMKQADDLFEKIVRKGIFPDLIMFNALIDGHCANGNMERAFALLKEMDQMK
ncbi:hypothetical protein OIU85_028070, partial [Salix viminalis]